MLIAEGCLRHHATPHSTGVGVTFSDMRGSDQDCGQGEGQWPLGLARNCTVWGKVTASHARRG